MKKICGLFFLVLFLFVSCDTGLFEKNLWSGLEKYEKPNFATVSAEELMRDGEKKSNLFFDSLTGGDVERVIDILNSAYETAEDDNKKSEILLFAAEVFNRTSGVDETFQNTVPFFIEVMEEGQSEFDVDELIERLLPSDNPRVVERHIDALLYTYEVYEAYGIILKDKSEEQIDKLSKRDKNRANTACQAAIAGLLNYIIEHNDSLDAESLAQRLVNDDLDGLDFPEFDDSKTIEEHMEAFLGEDIYAVVDAGLDLHTLISEE